MKIHSSSSSVTTELAATVCISTPNHGSIKRTGYHVSRCSPSAWAENVWFFSFSLLVSRVLLPVSTHEWHKKGDARLFETSNDSKSGAKSHFMVFVYGYCVWENGFLSHCASLQFCLWPKSFSPELLLGVWQQQDALPSFPLWPRGVNAALELCLQYFFNLLYDFNQHRQPVRNKQSQHDVVKTLKQHVKKSALWSQKKKIDQCVSLLHDLKTVSL